MLKELDDFSIMMNFETGKRLAELDKQLRQESMGNKNLTTDFSKLRDDLGRMKKQVGNLISISDDQQELIEGLNEFSLEVK
jgi:hypothetical protein